MRAVLLGAAALCGSSAVQALSIEEAASMRDATPDAKETDEQEDARLGYWAPRAKKHYCGEDCNVELMAIGKEDVQGRTLTQVNRGRLGNHLFQWAAMLSIAKEADFHAVVRDLKYKPKDTAQMRGLAPLVWGEDNYSQLERRPNLCHVWDTTPIVVDGGLPRLSMWSGWGQEKGTIHIPSEINPQSGENWAKLWADAIVNTTLPDGTRCDTWELDGFFQQQWFFADHMDLVREAFWHQPSADQAAYALKWLMYNEKGASVGMHIRLGDYKYTNRNMPITYYKDALEEVSRRNPNRTLSCVIFSDDIPEAMAVTEVLTKCDKRVPVPAELGEVSSFYMLGLLPNIIIADSSFSFWAARLSPAKPFVVAPGIYKDNSNAQSAYEYLLQTPAEEGWFMVNTTTEYMNDYKATPAATPAAAAMSQLEARTFPDVGSADAARRLDETGAGTARNRRLESEWAY